MHPRSSTMAPFAAPEGWQKAPSSAPRTALGQRLQAQLSITNEMSSTFMAGTCAYAVLNMTPAGENG